MPFHTKGSMIVTPMIVTPNKRVSEWAELFGEEVLAAAIQDPLLHDAEVLIINGPSYRLRGRLEAMNEAADEKGVRPKRKPEREAPGTTHRPTFFDDRPPTFFDDH